MIAIRYINTYESGARPPRSAQAFSGAESSALTKTALAVERSIQLSFDYGFTKIK